MCVCTVSSLRVMASFFLSRSQDGALTDGELEEDEPNFESLNEMESGQREEEEAGESFDDERPLRTVYPLALALSRSLAHFISLDIFFPYTIVFCALFRFLLCPYTFDDTHSHYKRRTRNYTRK